MSQINITQLWHIKFLQYNFDIPAHFFFFFFCYGTVPLSCIIVPAHVVVQGRPKWIKSSIYSAFKSKNHRLHLGSDGQGPDLVPEAVNGWCCDSFWWQRVPDPDTVWEEWLLVDQGPCVRYEEGGVISSRWNDWHQGSRWNIDLLVHNPVHHCSSGLGSSLLQQWPVELVHHVGHTASCAVVWEHHPGSPTLYHLQLVDVVSCVGVPDYTSIFHQRSYQCFVT